MAICVGVLYTCENKTKRIIIVGALMETMDSPVSAFVMAGVFGILGTIIYCVAIYQKRNKIREDYYE